VLDWCLLFWVFRLSREICLRGATITSDAGILTCRELVVAVESTHVPPVGILWLRRPKQRRPRDPEVLFRRPGGLRILGGIVGEPGLTEAVGAHHTRISELPSLLE
jgi:hypothetical protein